MKIEFDAKKILSKLAALFLISLPVGYLFFKEDQESKRLAPSLSHEELLDQTVLSANGSVFEAIIVIFVAGLFFLILIEPTALGLRKLFDFLTANKSKEIR